jgi:uncharacterized protein (DUF1330 family)
MTAYVICDIEVRDQQTYQEYTALVPGTLEPYGGRFAVRGGAHETLEGGWQPRRVVMLEFPSTDHARRWYTSDAYTAAKEIRLRSAGGSLVLVEGAD